MAGNLCGGPGRHKLIADASPVAFAEVLQALKKQPVFVFAPWSSLSFEGVASSLRQCCRGDFSFPRHRLRAMSMLQLVQAFALG